MRRARVLCPTLGIAVASLVAISSCAEDSEDLLASIQSRGTLKVASDADWAPQSRQLEDGSWEGFDVSVAEEIAKRLDVKLEFVTPDWDSITAGNWRDQWDISVGSMTVTEERSKVLHFVDPPYYYDKSYFLVQHSSTLTPADLEEKTICVSSGSTWEAWLTGTLTLPADQILENPPSSFQIVSKPGEGLCEGETVAGEVDTMVSSFGGTMSFTDDSVAAADRLKLIGNALFVEYLSVAVDKGHSLSPDSLVVKLGTIVQGMHDDGTLSTLSTGVYNIDLSKKE